MRISICPDSSSPYIRSLVKALRCNGVDVDLIPWYGKQTVYSASKTIASRLRGSQIVHFHWVPFNWVASRRFARSLCDTCNMKAVWTIHNLDFHFTQFGSEGADSDQMKAMMDWAKTGIVHCERTKLEFQEEFGRSLPLNVIPHGNFIEYAEQIDPESSRSALGISNEKTAVLLFAPNRWSKGIKEFVDIIESLPDNYVGILAGEVREKDIISFLNEAKRRSPDKFILDIRRYSRADMAKVFAASDLFLIPYKNITTSGTIMDAISYGKPVISRDMGNVSDLVINGVNGYLCESASEMVDAIERTDREQLRKMGNASLDIAHRYDWDQIAKDTIKVYESII